MRLTGDAEHVNDRDIGRAPFAPCAPNAGDLAVNVLRCRALSLCTDAACPWWEILSGRKTVESPTPLDSLLENLSRITMPQSYLLFEQFVLDVLAAQAQTEGV